MKILVTCKRVPDPDIKIKLTPDGAISDDGMKFVVNYFDEIANEEALRIMEKVGDTEVVVLGIGPKEISTEIRKCLAMGSQRGIHVVTDAELDSDAVANIVAKVVEQESPDLIMMGKQATDDDSAQAGQILASLLGYPQACYASEVALADDKSKATVIREVDGGLETIDINFPAVITCDLRLNEPRYASLPNIMKAKRKPIADMSFDDLGISPEPKVKVIGFTAPPERKAGEQVADVDALIDKLQNEAKVL